MEGCHSPILSVSTSLDPSNTKIVRSNFKALQQDIKQMEKGACTAFLSLYSMTSAFLNMFLGGYRSSQTLSHLRNAPLLPGFKSWQPTLVDFLDISAEEINKYLRVPWLTHIHPCRPPIPAQGLMTGRGNQRGERKKQPYHDCLHPYRLKQWQGSPGEGVSVLKLALNVFCRVFFFCLLLFPADRQS